MRKPAYILLLAGLGLAGCFVEVEQEVRPVYPAAPNLFADWLGRSEAEIDAKIEAAWAHFFEGDPVSQRLYYEVGDEMAYIWDVANDDVRSEGMSYGMMIAAQMDRKEAFDRLWQWTVTHMRHDSGPLEGYFAWHCKTDGTRLSEGPASDGEEWFAMALLFAGHRWGDGEGIFHYTDQARAILHAMPVREPHHHYIPMFDAEAAMVRFVPNRDWERVTDPSYHLPAFYELWARWDPTYRELWQRAATVSRAHFRAAAHPETGLMPDYATFEGEPYIWRGHEDFRFDAWRTLSNVALDWAWWRADPWAVEQSNRILSFFAGFGDDLPNQMTLDGQALSEDTSPGLWAMAATAGLAADRGIAEPFVARFWDLPLAEGHYRYYDGLLQFLGLLQVSGRFQIHAPHDRPE
jgi:oligosaccharide reducing-end xylanase